MRPVDAPTPDATVRMVERLVYLQSLPGLATASRELLSVVAAACQESSWHPGEVLLTKKEVPRCAYLVVEGSVRVGEADSPSLGPRGAVGLLSLLAGMPQPESAVAETETLTLDLAADTLFDLWEDPAHGFGSLLPILQALAAAFIDNNLAASSVVDGNAPAARRSDNPDWIERLLYLRTIPLLADADPDALATFARALQPFTLRAGERLWAPDSSAEPIHLVHGTVAQSTGDDDPPSLHQGPAALGLLEALGLRPPPRNAIARTAVVALRGDHQLLLDIIEDEPSIGIGMLSVLARGLVEHGAPG